MLLQRTQKTHESTPSVFPMSLSATPDLSRISRLTNENKSELLSFLSLRPVHTVVMKSFIIDNGVESQLNRGTFYGHRNADGDLDGVALIGHSTLVEARSDKAMQALAITAQHSATPINLIMSDGEAAESFWNYFSGGKSEPRLRCTEELFELNFPFLVKKCKWEVRYAKLDELEEIAKAQAEVALLESGVDPLFRDHAGFLKRVAKRIEQNRIFVVVENDKLIFKAD